METLAIAKAEEKKKQGNEEHKKGNYTAAVRLYQEAIGINFFTLIRYRLSRLGALLLHKQGSLAYPDEGVQKSDRRERKCTQD